MNEGDLTNRIYENVATGSLAFSACGNNTAFRSNVHHASRPSNDRVVIQQSKSIFHYSLDCVRRQKMLLTAAACCLLLGVGLSIRSSASAPLPPAWALLTPCRVGVASVPPEPSRVERVVVLPTPGVVAARPASDYLVWPTLLLGPQSHCAPKSPPQIFSIWILVCELATAESILHHEGGQLYPRDYQCRVA